MSNRLSKIYTRTGDKGKTSLANGSRIAKSELIFEVMGDIDELNAYIGMVDCLLTDNDIFKEIDLKHSISIIQHLLFNLGGELAMWQSEYAYQGIKDNYIKWLEDEIDSMNSHLQPLQEFILPKGTQSMCQLHIARTVCRRAERHAISLNIKHQGAISDIGLCFLNRLSDWLFVACRFVGLQQLDEYQHQEILWDSKILED